MPAKRDKRVAAKVPKEVDDNEGNAEEQEIEIQVVKKKGRLPKVKAVSQQAEQPEKKPARGRKNKNDPETDENERVFKGEDTGAATATVSKRVQASKKPETEKSTDTGTEAAESQRKGAIRVEEAGEKEKKTGKARGRKVADKGVEIEDAEPAVKKSRGRPKGKEDSSETKPNRKVRQQKNASKGKQVTERSVGVTENDGSDQNFVLSGKELKVNIEHW
jgi:hypothetical protein